MQKCKINTRQIQQIKITKKYIVATMAKYQYAKMQNKYKIDTTNKNSQQIHCGYNGKIAICKNAK